MTELNIQKIQDKWQKAWEKQKIGEVEPDKRPKFFIIWAYPTVSGFLHSGHMRGYSYADFIGRYKRLQGFNVLLTTGGHATGNGAIAKALKIENKDKDMIEDLKARGLSGSEIAELSDPEKFIEYFADSYIEDFKRFGFLGDWRRNTVTINPDYKKFIDWQFHKLKEHDLLIQKPYYATACIKCGPVAVDPSEMDLSKGGNAEVNEYTLIKLQFENENQYIVCATLRPETMFGQTNIWVHPDINYVKAKVGPETWILSKEAGEKMQYLKDEVRIIGQIAAKEMLGKKCKAPMTDREIPILPATFCNPTIGTGIVTSVPSDAPHDYIALHDLQKDKKLCEKYNLNHEEIKEIKLIPIIKTQGYGDFPAKEICEKMHITSQSDTEKLDEAKKEIYKQGFHSGVMAKTAGAFAGQKVAIAKEEIKKTLIEDGDADIMHDLSEEVICRCGSPVVMKKSDDQWFIRYSDKELTTKAKQHAESMNIWPDNYKENIGEAIEWFQDRPCARQGRWLGTTFPFDNTYIIEAISDSTIYPIYYLVTKYVNEDSITPENLTHEFFDYIFLSKGDKKSVAKNSGVPIPLLDQIKADVDYWYPLDINLGGKEHRRVHFPPFIKNHVAILPQKFWPKGIFVNEWVIQAKNQKISKSKGGALPIPGVAEKFTVDAVRLYYANSASPFVDVYFNEDDIINYKNRIERIYNQFEELTQCKGKDEIFADTLLISQLQSKILAATEHIEHLDFKKATDIIYIEISRDLNDYLKNGGSNKKNITEAIEIWATMMSVFTPHCAEECWSKLNKPSLVCTESWPEADESRIDKDAEQSYKTLNQIISDIRQVLELAKIEKPNKITLFTASPWKYTLFSETEKQLEKTRDFKELLQHLMKQSELKQFGKEISKMLPNIIKKGIPTHLSDPESEYHELKKHILQIESTFNCKVHLEKAESSTHPKAANASPGKPAILVE